MTEFFYYLLKMIMCSGIFFLYYYLFQRNSVFHQWNRFYLLLAVSVSILIPFLRFPIYQDVGPGPRQTIELLQVVDSAHEYLEEVSMQGTQGMNQYNWAAWIYVMISVFFLLILFRSLFHIARIIATHKARRLEKAYFINTNIPGTPFSFFNFVFWNRAIDPQSETGQQILLHELVHVRQKHSFDSVFLQLVLVFFWSNPFFWLIRREMRLIHEYIADRQSVGDGGAPAFAAMILHSAYPAKFHSLTSPYFQTSIKRRLSMLTKMQKPGFNKTARILALPVMLATILAFTVRTENLPSVTLENPVTVVIDAGHGKLENGKFSGARHGELYEDQLNLSISKKIMERNRNQKINIVLTRATDVNIGLKERVELSKEKNADLFLSIHTGANPEQAEKNGLEVFVSGKNIPRQQDCELFGSLLRQELSAVYTTFPGLKKPATGIWVLDQNSCPTALLELGYITNEKDLNFISDPQNQDKVADRILLAIERYFASKQN
jgi:N-acetylmuramoyl-L-alanine amidase